MSVERTSPQVNEQFYDDLQKAVGLLRRAFLRQGLKPPSSIMLADHRTGDHMRASMPRDLVKAFPHFPDNGPEWVINLQGVDFRYPGMWEAEPRGRKLV